MSRICAVCNKGPHVGNLVSHANNRTKRWVYPNVHKVRYTLTGQMPKKVQRGAVCTKCVKAGKIEKVI
ncbi:MAG: 50S ribosomal protein L28 [Candidatus Babeliales bacterium]